MLLGMIVSLLIGGMDKMDSDLAPPCFSDAILDFAPPNTVTCHIPWGATRSFLFC